MLRSKATAALMRLKEMDRKYNIKCNEGKRGQSNVSTESSIDDTPRNQRAGFKAASNNKPDTAQGFTAIDAEDEVGSKIPPKSTIQVRIPSLVGKDDDDDDVSSSVNSSASKKSPEDSSKISIETSLADKNRTGVRLKEESVSRTANESRKTLLSSPRSVSREGNLIVKARVEIVPPNNVSRHENSDVSSVATILSEVTGDSKTVTGTYESMDVVESSTRRNERKRKVPEEKTTKNNAPYANVGNEETTMDELTGISDERSEIISELSRATNKDGEPSNNSLRVRQKEYESDTFEEVSSSTSSSVEDRSGKIEEAAQSTIRSGVKQITITPHKRTESVQRIVTVDRDKEIIELVAPKIIQDTSKCDIGLDVELSNYVKTTENVDEVPPISLLKLPKQTSTNKQPRRNKRHRKSSDENMNDESRENTEWSVIFVHEKSTKRKENKNKDDSSRANSPSSTFESRYNVELQQCRLDIGVGIRNVHVDTLILARDQRHGTCKSDDSRKTDVTYTKSDNVFKKRQKNEKRTETKINPLVYEQGKIEKIDAEKEAPENHVQNVDSKNVSDEVLLRETPRTSNVTCTLRELNRDAIDAIVKRHRVIRGSGNTLEKSRKYGIIVKPPSVEYETPEKDQTDESKPGSLENLKESVQDHGIKKRSKAKRVSKVSKARKPSSRGKVEEKHSRLDCRQSRCLRQQAAALRLQQEREDIRNYLLELEHTRIEFGPGNSFASSKLDPFKPLEFPKIAAFVKPEPVDVNVKSKHEVAAVQERILTIKQWLKDQYVLYRDYSSLAQTVNAKYIPASLEDAKRTIRQLQKAMIKTR
ncbi:uncharacterized protein LOC143146940 [Ptiloglossa arizonensis]|uniref:uncharacterized protein LOC143146940 n=1 Tax=Ptiloglossa arizonensis TaxID=3350558 RepID=UPI003FA12778